MGAVKHVLAVDLETFSATDIAKCGSYKYMEDPEFEILLMAYAYDDADVVVLDFTAGDPIPAQVLKDLTDPGVTKTAFNCAFEREALRQHLGVYMPPEQWEDTMILAAQCGLPMSLKGASEALGLSEDEAKMKEGKALIKYFCQPCKPTKTNGGRTRNLPEHAPEKWTTFKHYNGMDVVAERAIRKRLIRWKPLPEEHAFWCLDAKINERGVRIDRQLAVNAVAMDEKYKAELTERAIAITGLDNPKSVSQVKNWLADQEGKSFPSLNKKVIADVVSELETDEAKEFMAIRSELSKSSTAKYAAMLRSMCKDDHVRGCFAFYGANRTGRFAGRLVQFQNMSKNEMPDIATCRDAVKNGHYSLVKCLYDGVAKPLSELVRTSIIPEDGHQLLVADFSAIEARVIAWLAGEQWRLDVFRNGGDIYCASASQMFKVPVVKHGENGHLRQKGKIAELALGYGGPVGALKAMGALNMGVPEEELKPLVDAWRLANPNIVRLWWDIDRAASTCVRERTTTECRGIRFIYQSGMMFIVIPSGRKLVYVKPRMGVNRFGNESVTFEGVGEQKKWLRLESYGPKFVENIVQATARDILAEAMLRLDAHGYKIVMHVHDEAVIEAPANTSLDNICEVMGQTPTWAKGLLLRADGYICDFYKKD